MAEQPRGWIVAVLLGVAAAASLAPSATAQQLPLPPVTFPTENPFSEPKRVLGKMLFWDEQLSMTNTMACGTCHRAQNGGSDPRPATHPGPDGLFGTLDDKHGSPGVLASDAVMNYVDDLRFAFGVQSTDRVANTVVNAAYEFRLFWDGRADPTFRDPLTGQVAIETWGALESQAVGPPMSNVEMAHTGANWPALTAKLADARPLALAQNLPPDVAAALPADTTYAQLFEAAFGDPAVTPVRIAFAIATYERTLIADDTPWDRTARGEPGGMTPLQLEGEDQFLSRRCGFCHTPPFFGDHVFRNVGVRPPAEDRGRQNVTGLSSDRGKFKTGILRNIGLKTRFMHNGQFATLNDVLLWYGRALGAHPQFVDNIDPIMSAVTLPEPSRIAVLEFLTNGLLDVRVRDGLFPFDRPTLTSEVAARQITVLPGGISGTGGLIPQVIADTPALVGANFRFGVADAMGEGTARLGLSLTAPAGGGGGMITPDSFLGEAQLSETGVATLHWQIDPADYTDGQILYLQWFIDDPVAIGGVAASNVARVPVFCGRDGCPPPPCLADFGGDGIVDSTDFFAYLAAFFAGAPEANVNGDQVIDSGDFFAYLAAFFAGC